MKSRRVPDGRAGRPHVARKRARPPAAAPARKQGGESTSPAAEQMVFRYRRTHAERIAVGELCDAGDRARAAGFRWPLAVSAELWRQVETVPPDGHPKETAADRWRHVLLLAAPAAAQILRDNLRELRINVVLRTTAGPERSREHIKTLLLAAERAPEGGASFALGYPADP